MAAVTKQPALLPAARPNLGEAEPWLSPPRTASAAGQSGLLLAHPDGCSQDPPPRAASRATWAFGNTEDGKTIETLH